MDVQRRLSGVLRGLLIACIGVIISACSSGSEQETSDDVNAAFVISGSVGDGPIVNGTIEVFGADGALLVSGESDGRAQYTIEVPAGAVLPIEVRVSGGTDLVTNRAADFELVSLITAAGEQTVNVSPLTTLAVKAAQCRGDETDTGLNRSWEDIARRMNIGLDTTNLGDPMTQTIDGSNIETAVLSNEAVGEIVRRTASALTDISTDNVIAAMACDLADGRIDGEHAGPDIVNAERIFAVAKAVEATVRLEVIAGRLEVDAADATSAMNASIRTVEPSVSNPDVNTVPVTAQAISDAVDALTVLMGVFDDQELGAMSALLSASTPATVRTNVDTGLDAGTSNTLVGLAERVALSDDSVIRSVASRASRQDAQAAPIVSLSAQPESVDPGEASLISWATSGADQCEASWADGAQSDQGVYSTPGLQQATTYTLSCSGLGGVTVASVEVSVNGTEPIDSPNVSLTSSASAVDSGDSATLTWSSTNATSCTASGGWSGTQATSGSQVVGPLNADTTFTLTCSGQGGTAASSVSIDVAAPIPDPEPTVNLSASASTIDAGESVTLTWSSANATSCSAAGGWSGSKAVSGSEAVGPLNANTTFSISCSGTGGVTETAVNVTVNAVEPDPEPTVSLSASEASVDAGANVTLTWSSTDASSCSASGAWSGSRATSGSAVVGPVNATSTFTLTCTGSGGTAVSMVSVEAVGSISLSWQAPTDNTDGTPISGISGYRIFYGTSSGAYGSPVDVTGSATSTVLNLPVDTYFIAMTVLDTNGQESGYSNEVQRSAQ